MADLLPCPFCSKTMMLRSALWPSEGDADAIIHADPTDCPMLGFSDGSADGSIIEKWNCSLSNEDDFPSDGSCVRCGSVPRNANGLCNTCLDEDAERLENTRTTPVAPVSPDTDGKCGELVTVAQAHFDEFGEFDDIAWIKGFHPHPECIQLVTRSQAEELLAAKDKLISDLRSEIESLSAIVSSGIDDLAGASLDDLETALAAERAEKDGWKELHDAAQVAVKERTEACNNLYKQVNDLKADNAAKDARNNELESKLETATALVTCCCGDPVDAHNMGSGHSPVDQYHYTMMQLEAKLAAAEQALKTARPYVEDYDTRRHNTGVDETLTQIDAVLGGKPL